MIYTKIGIAKNIRGEWFLFDRDDIDKLCEFFSVLNKEIDIKNIIRTSKFVQSVVWDAHNER